MKRNKIAITKKKQEHVAKNKTNVLRGHPLNYPASIEEKYRKKLDALILQMTTQTQREITRLFKGDAAKQFFGQDESIASQSRIVTKDLKSRFEQLFNRKSKGFAESMVNQADKQSTSNLHSSLKELSGGLSLKTSMISKPMKDIIKASVAENVSLIRSIPQQYFHQIEGAVMRSITTGNGLEDLVPFMEKQKGITKRRASLIARDQTRKAYNGLNAGRMEAIGLKKYEWLHSAGDIEPRPLHLPLSGNIFSFDDPPVIQYAKGSLPEVRGKPGDLINCSCKMVPIIEFDESDDQEE